MTIINAWQWDTDIPVRIPYAGTTAPELDFMPDTGTGQTVRPVLSDGILTAQCPPQLLKSSRPIQIYARQGNTIDRVGMICIRPRPKPPDYIDTPEAVRTWEEHEKRITQLEEDQASGGITAETDPTVPEWAKNPTKPPYTAAEVGALPDTTKTLPNPCALTLAGAVSAEYDGSEPVTVEIPVGGGETATVQETELAAGVIAAGSTDETATSTGVTIGDLRKWKVFCIRIEKSADESVYIRMSINGLGIFYTTKKALYFLFTWLDNARTVPYAFAIQQDSLPDWITRPITYVHGAMYVACGNNVVHRNLTVYNYDDATNVDISFNLNGKEATTADTTWKITGVIKYDE